MAGLARVSLPFAKIEQVFDTVEMGALRESNTSAGGPRRSSLRAVVDRAGGGVAGLKAVTGHVAPLVMAGDRRLDVLPALAHVLPEGLQRGSTVGVRGTAVLSLALAVCAGPVAGGAWMATLGCNELSLVGAEQAGVALHRMVMVTQPPPSSWGAVAAALVDAFDVVLVGGSSAVHASDARRLLSRARERGGIIIDVANSWSEAPDLVLEVTGQQWVGLGDGHGVLTARQVTIEVSGRRGVRPRQVPLWLPGPSSGPEAIDPVSLQHDGFQHDAFQSDASQSDTDHRYAGGDITALADTALPNAG